jgi:anti-sigma factor RsiW
MNREHRPELEDGQLLAYLDGEAGPEVAAHVEHCPECRERARRLASLQASLTAGLYRHACPSSTDLGEYHLGLLSRDRQADMACHLAQCPHCSRELAQLEAYLADVGPDIEISAVEQVMTVIARLIRDAQASWQLPGLAPAPAFAGLRGEGSGPLIYQAGEVQIAIEFQQDPAERDRSTLLGLVTGADPVDFQARLWQENELVASGPVDELGNLNLSGLAAGRYTLVLSGPEVEIRIEELEVG